MNEATKEKIEGFIKNNDVFLFMKGTPEMPQCGFSARVVQILSSHVQTFGSCNVLEDQEIWQGIKEFSNWPTIPQLYIKGKFIGGCDITIELEESGELQKLIN